MLLLAATAGAQNSPYTLYPAALASRGGDYDTGTIAAYDADGNPVVVSYYDRVGGSRTGEIVGDSVHSFVQWVGPDGGPVPLDQATRVSDDGADFAPYPWTTGPNFQEDSDCWRATFDALSATPGTYGILVPPSVVVGCETEVFDHWQVSNAITAGKCRTGEMGIGVVDGSIGGPADSVNPSSPPSFPSGPEYRIWTDLNNNLGMGATIEARYARVSPDTTAPLVTIAPSTVCASVEQHSSTLQADFSCQEPGGLGRGVASCVGTDAAGRVQDGDPLDASTVGAHMFTVTATDVAGNTRSSTVGYTVVGAPNTPPTLSLPSDQTVEATGPGGAPVDYAASASDAEDGLLPSGCTAASGSTFALGATRVSCSVTDSGGLTASGTFNVTVVDTTPPKLRNLPSDITAEATGPNGARVSWGPLAAEDLVDGSRGVYCSLDSVTTFFPLGTMTVSCSATDAHGNTATGPFNVTVVDTTPPTLHLPSDITTPATGPNGATVTYTATATDLVNSVQQVDCTPRIGQLVRSRHHDGALLGDRCLSQHRDWVVQSACDRADRDVAVVIAHPALATQPVTLTATVTPAPDGGAVAFDNCDAAIAGCGAVPVSTTTGIASCQTSALMPALSPRSATLKEPRRIVSRVSPVASSPTPTRAVRRPRLFQR
jgi:hypothetical protein